MSNMMKPAKLVIRPKEEIDKMRANAMAAAMEREIEEMRQRMDKKNKEISAAVAAAFGEMGYSNGTECCANCRRCEVVQYEEDETWYYCKHDKLYGFSDRRREVQPWGVCKGFERGE